MPSLCPAGTPEVAAEASNEVYNPFNSALEQILKLRIRWNEDLNEICHVAVARDCYFRLRSPCDLALLPLSSRAKLNVINQKGVC